MLSVNLMEAISLVTHCGHKATFLFSGEPGIGKSAMLGPIAQQTGCVPVYVDCTLMDVGDVQMPRVTDVSVRFVPNEMFVPAGDRPLVVMLDELGKAPKAVRNALLPLLYEHRIGAHRLPEGSIVFATTNLATDGVGDQVEAHARNRVSSVVVRKPNAQEWVKWAQAHNVNPAVVGWVQEFPHALQSYSNSAESDDNPYIFNPKRPAVAFVTPRSLVAAGHIIDQADHLPPSALQAALAGCVGMSAAADMEAFVSLRGEIAGLWTRILADGTKASVPGNPLSHILIVTQAVQRLLQDPDPQKIIQWMKYLPRLPREVQALFTAQAGQHGALVAAMYHAGPEFRAWAVENRWMNS